MTGKHNGTSSKTREYMVKTSVSIDEETRGMMIELLNQHLANMSDLYSQSKQAHWNVKGPGFFSLHELYDTLAEGVLPHIDEIGERVTALGGAAAGTVRMAAQNSQLAEFPAAPVSDVESLQRVRESFATAANSMRAAIDAADDVGDMVTADIFTGITGELDKYLYFLDSHQSK